MGYLISFALGCVFGPLVIAAVKKGIESLTKKV
jgi:hypothetical protein